MSAPTLRTERLVMRGWRTSDRAAFAAMNADPKVMEHFPGTMTRAESDGFADRIETHFAEHGFGLWAVELRATGEFIGDCGLVYVEGKGPEVEVAYHFAKEWWGRGLATEAATACLDYGFRELGLREIIAICFPEHVASRRVMEKAGMRYVGPARYYELDLVKYVANDRR